MYPSEYQRLFENEQHHWWFCARRAIARALLDHYLPPARGRRRILDAGCGTGGNLALLRRYGRVVGLDLSPLALSLAHTRTTTGVTLTLGSLLAVPCADETFHLVTAFDVLYHQWVVDDVAALVELRRVLKPGGLLLVTDSAWRRLRSGHDEINLARERYEVPELRARLHRAGFEPLRVSYANSLLLPLILAIRAARRLTARGWEWPRSDVAPVPAPLNKLLYGVYRSEAALLPYVNLPRGSSVVAIARRR
ncbi:MAG: class I SAM-dependent methyltransferase [Ardenticatenaceae bacterium]|nr:class I SAM-dependent methyltransferase [Ardenticatenaceae bacterium]